MRKVLPRLAIPVVVATLLSACGIGSGPVITDHVAEKADTGQASGGGGPALRGDLHINDPSDLVRSFLRASAGDGSAMKSYVAEDDSWSVSKQVLKVVRLEDIPKPTNTVDGYTVNVRVQHIGVLNDNGQLLPSTEGIKDYVYNVITEAGKLMLRDPPKDRLLPDLALENFYVDRPVYFWSGDALVADPRYVFKALSLEAQSNQLVDFLYAGPSQWLDGSVERLPSEARPGVTKVVRGDKGRLVIDLQAQGQEFQKLAEQLAQTLVVAPQTGLQIKVQGQEKIANQGTRDDRVVYQARRYAVVDTRVRRLTAGGVDAEEMLPAEESKNLVAVAFAKDERAVAVVRQEGSSQRLRVGTRSVLREVILPTAVSSISQPIWLDGGTQLLVVADQAIYQVGIDGKAELKQVISGLTSMSVAADGHRLVLVVGGVLHLTSRGADGSINFPLRSYRIPTKFSSVQGAVFGGRGMLLVAGTGSDGLRRLMRMKIDGTQQAELENRWHQGLTIGRLVADPYTGNAMFELQGEAYEVRQNGSMRLADEMTLPSPSPNGKPKVVAPSFEGWL